MKLTVEEHGAGRQMVRLRAWPKWSRTGRYAVIVLAMLACGAWAADALVMSGVLAGAVAAIAILALDEMTVAMGVLVKVVQGEGHVPSRRRR